MLTFRTVWLYLLLSIISIQNIKSVSSSKSYITLQKAVIKPIFCGGKYFVNLEKKIVINFEPQMAAEPSMISQYCKKFSALNGVNVNILDAQGIDMCSFRNPISALYAQIFTLLNQRSANDRYQYYQNLILGNTVPSPSVDPNFDVIGLLRFYNQIWVLTFMAEQELNRQIALISQYPDIGNQGVAAIQYSTAVTATVASFPPSLAAYESFLAQIGYPYDVSFNNQVKMITAFLFRYYEALHVQTTPINTILTNLNKEKMIILAYLNTFGIIKNQASPLYVNALQDGLCYWAENRFFGPNGIMYRIVFSQQANDFLLL